MDVQSLKQFQQLATMLHFGRAAAAANISPSGLSRSIRRLEDELGCVLFDRNNREVKLTPQGRLLQAQAEELLQRLQSLRARLQSGRRLQGTVSLYCSVTASYSLLSRLLPDFRDRYPEVEVKVHTGDEASAISRVLQGSEELAIAACPDRLPRGMVFTELSETPLVFIAPVSGPAALHALESDVADTSAVRWENIAMIVPEKGLSRARLDQWFRERGLQPNIYAQVSGNETIVGMVALGFGVGVVPMLVLRSSPFRESVRVLDVQPQMRSFRIGLCCLKRTLDNPLVAAFWNLAATEFAAD